MTFLDLKNNLRDYLNRDDITPLIGNWINMSQKGIERLRNWSCLQARTSDTFSVDTIAMPENYKSVEWLMVKDGDMYYPLSKNSPQEIFLKYPIPNSTKSRPCYFTSLHSSSKFLVRPVPDKEYGYDLLYYAYLVDLADDTDTNWWTLNAYDVVLYGALIIGARYIQNTEAINHWTALYQSEIQKLIRAEVDEAWRGSKHAIGMNYPAPFNIEAC